MSLSSKLILKEEKLSKLNARSYNKQIEQKNFEKNKETFPASPTDGKSGRAGENM